MRPRKAVSRRVRRANTTWLNWKKLGLVVGGGAVALLVLVQLLYPSDRLMPLTVIDGQQVGWLKKQDAATTLNSKYADYTVALYMGSEKKPVTTPKLSTIDIKVDNTARINAIDYPWYMRLIPSSLFWAGRNAREVPSPVFGDKFVTYIDKHLMPDCRQAPQNATLKADGKVLAVVSAISGGICEQKQVVASIKKIRPQLTKTTSVRVARKEEPPAISDESARLVATDLKQRLGDGVSLDVLGAPQAIAVETFLPWLDFEVQGATLMPRVSIERAGDWLNKTIAPKVAIKPGVSMITTRDFTELTRTNGASGRALDLAMTVASLQRAVESDQAPSVATKTVPPTEQYSRTYSPSDVGLSALMTNYAHDHPGTFGISMIELDGKKRRADHNGDKQFVTASTYKLLVAYSLLKQIDTGQRDWESNAACFNKMISQSDNPCAEAFLSSLTLKTVSSDVQAIGLKNSTFVKNGGPFTTANDMTLLLGMIATGQNFSSSNQQRLISAMKANIYRKGIPAGASGTVANKVGFLNGLLHDAAIVYSPSGTYALAIMTDGSSWATIADLAKHIDTLRAQ